MQKAMFVRTPLAALYKLSVVMPPWFVEEKNQMSHVPYVIAVRSIMYAMICTRPDISQAISVVSMYMGHLGKKHW